MSQEMKSTHCITAVDQNGEAVAVHIVNEYPLTIKVNGKEIVTLMTLGPCPEDLVVGYLRNQRLIEDFSHIQSVRVDWETETVHVRVPADKIQDLKEKMTRKIVTTGCGEGTVFSCSLDKIYENQLTPFPVQRSVIYELLDLLRTQGQIYKIAGSVHSCALCSPKGKVWHFVEDVGRHNAADAIAGQMWAKGISGRDKILYTTGRITSEIVIKAVLMEIPVILSRSGITKMGLTIAQDLNLTVIGRAKAKKFVVYTGHEHIRFNA